MIVAKASLKLRWFSVKVVEITVLGHGLGITLIAIGINFKVYLENFCKLHAFMHLAMA